MANDHRDSLAVIPWYHRDWRASTARAMMSPLERGLYRELLDAMWEQSECTLPDEDRVLAGLAGCHLRTWSRARETVLSFLPLDGNGRRYNPRAKHEWQKARDWRASCRESGRRGGLARSSEPQATLERPSSSPSPSPSPTTRKKKQDAIAAVAKAPAGCAEALRAFGKGYARVLGAPYHAAFGRDQKILGGIVRQYGLPLTVEMIEAFWIEQGRRDEPESKKLHPIAHAKPDVPGFLSQLPHLHKFYSWDNKPQGEVNA